MAQFLPTNQRARRHFCSLVLTSLLVGGTFDLAAAQSGSAVMVGQRLPDLVLKDQHGKPWQIEPSTRLVMFSASRKASSLVQEVLQTLSNDQMARRGAVYLADMSKMPGFITRTFALPSLQKLPYAIGVSLDEATLANWPQQADAVTLIELDPGAVKHISYATAQAALRAALAP